MEFWLVDKAAQFDYSAAYDSDGIGSVLHVRVRAEWKDLVSRKRKNGWIVVLIFLAVCICLI